MPRPGDDPSPYWTVDETGADARENYALAAATAVAAALEQRRLPLEVEQQIVGYARPTDLFAVDVHDEAFFIVREDLVGDKRVGFVEFKGAKEVHIRRARFGICGRMI